MISFGPLDPAREASALEQASAAQFGPEGYQHFPQYLEWLYRANPSARGLKDCLVARQQDAIVGCLHRMILPLAGAGEGERLAVLHNHFVQDAVRAGPGVLLLRRAVKDVQAGFAPGVQAPLDEMYRRLGFEEVPGSWLMRSLSPVAGALQLASARWRESPPIRVDLSRLRRRFDDLVVTGEPDEAAITALCSAMRLPLARAVGVDWTAALVRWRYFHPLGPRHLWIATQTLDEWAVISLGRRRGVGVARVLELAPGASGVFVNRALAVARAAGASLALSFSTDPAMIALLISVGWRLRGNGTFSFRTGGASLALGPGASDVGFEAFRTVIA